MIKTNCFTLRGTFLLVIFLFSSNIIVSGEICNPFCDGWDPVLVSCPIREPVELQLNGRRLVLRVSDSANTAWALALNGEAPNDEVWVDRSWDGGRTHEELLGRQHVTPDKKHAASLMFNCDDPAGRRIGVLRACGNLGGQTTCTAWARSNVNAGNRLDAAVTAMMMYYQPNRGLFSTVGWWNAANDITVLIDYQRYTGRNFYEWAIDNTFELNKGQNEFGGENFQSGSIDDTLWWGLAWVRAYDLTGNRKYLDTAIRIADYVYDCCHDDACGGGVWTVITLVYKNAVTNEQYIKLAAQLHNRIEGDTKFLEQSRKLWGWFLQSGMINGGNLINDGLDGPPKCSSNGFPTWTYNQGIILGAAAELYKATGEQSYLDEARKIADAVVKSGQLNDEHRALREPPPHCQWGPDPNCACFKGIFMRNLLELNLELADRPYSQYILRQADLIYERNRNTIDQYGLVWSGPIDEFDASRQQSAVDALLAAEVTLNDLGIKMERNSTNC